MNTTSFLDKQIMDLSQGSKQQQHQNDDFIDLMKMNTNTNNSRRKDGGGEEEHQVGGTGNGNGISKKEFQEMLPSYDFQPIRPVVGASSPSRSFDAAPNLGGGATRAWNSGESKSNTASPIRNYGSMDSLEPGKLILEKDRNAAIVSEIDQTMKKHADNLLHMLEGVSARLTQLESRTRNLENSVDDLKISVGNNHGNTDGTMRQLEGILRDVQTGVKDMKDKQEIVEAQLNLARIQMSNPKIDPQPEPQNAGHVDSGQTPASAPQHSHQQIHPPVNLPPSIPAVSHPNAPSQPMPQSVPHTVQHPNQFSQNQIPTVPQRDPYFPAPGQTQEAPNQQYQLPPGQQPVPPPPVPPHQQFQPATQPRYSQPPPQLPQQHPSLAPVNPSQIQPTLGHHAEESPYIPSQNYPPTLRQPPSHTPGSLPPSQQYYSPAANAYEPPPSRPSSGYPSGYNPPSGLGESYQYGGPPSQYGGSSSMKPQHHSSSATAQSGGSGYPQLPTARVLPHANPTPSGPGGSSPSSGSGSRVPIDDVIDQVATMGFSRDQVRAAVQKLTDSGQAVDLNVVLDKLMNDGDVQQPRGKRVIWFLHLETGTIGGMSQLSIDFEGSMELKVSSPKPGGLSPSDCISDPEEKELSDDDDDDRNHKHRRRDTRSQSLETDTLDQVITRPFRNRNKPFVNGNSFRDNDSQASTPWRNQNSTDFSVKFDKRRPGSTSLPRAPFDLNHRIRANQAFPGDLGPGRGRGRDYGSWSQRGPRFNSDFASQMVQQGSIRPSLFPGRGLPNVSSAQSGSWNAFGLIPGIPNGSMDTLHSIGLQGTLRPPIHSSLNMGIPLPRCRDFEERGFCLRGDMCPMEHGVNRIVIEDVQSLSQFNLPVSIPNAHLLGKPTGPGSLPSVSASSTALLNSKSLHGKTSKTGVTDDGLGVNGSYSGPGYADGADLYDPDQPLWNNNCPETSNALLGLQSPRNDETETLLNDADNEFPIRSVGTASSSQSTSMSVWGRIGSSKSRLDVKEKIEPVINSSDYIESDTKEGKEALVNIQTPPRQGKRIIAEDGPNTMDSLPKTPFDSTRNIRRPSQKALRTLFVNGIPQKNNKREALLSHFQKFGEVIDIYIPSNSERAFIQFSRREEAEAALTAPDAVMGNRFIRLWWANRDRIPDEGTGTPSNFSGTPHGVTTGSVPLPPHSSGASISKDNLQSAAPKGSIVHASDASLPAIDNSKPITSNDPKAPPLQKKLDSLEQLKEELRKKQEMLAQKRNDFRRQLDKLEKQATGPKGETDTEQAAKRPKVGTTTEAGKAVTPNSSNPSPADAMHAEMTDKNKSGESIVSCSPKPSTPVVLQQSPSLKLQTIRPLGPLGSPSPLNRYKLDNRPTGFKILPPLPAGFANVAIMKEHFSPYGDLSNAELEDLESREGDSELEKSKDCSARITFTTRRSAERAFLNGKCWEGHDLKFIWLTSSTGNDRSGRENSPSTTPKGPLPVDTQPADKEACIDSQEAAASGNGEPEHSERISGVEDMESDEHAEPSPMSTSGDKESSQGDAL
ncbi:hypothetical protein EV1_044505 [Malus domestica]